MVDICGTGFAINPFPVGSSKPALAPGFWSQYPGNERYSAFVEPVWYPHNEGEGEVNWGGCTCVIRNTGSSHLKIALALVVQSVRASVHVLIVLAYGVRFSTKAMWCWLPLVCSSRLGRQYMCWLSWCPRFNSPPRLRICDVGCLYYPAATGAANKGFIRVHQRSPSLRTGLKGSNVKPLRHPVALREWRLDCEL